MLQRNERQCRWFLRRLLGSLRQPQPRRREVCCTEFVELKQQQTANVSEQESELIKAFITLFLKVIFILLPLQVNLVRYVDGCDFEQPPLFGNSESDFNEVKQFYGWWQSYCTKKSYMWLDDLYDVRQVR